MAIQPIIVHCLNKNDQEFAMATLDNAVIAPSYVFGYVDGEKVPGLRDKNLIITECDCPESELEGDFAKSDDLAALDDFRAGRAVAGEGVVPLAQLDAFLVDTFVEIPRFEEGTPYFLVEFHGPCLPEWREKLEGIGIRVVERVRRYTFKLAALNADASRIVDFPFVRWVKPWGATLTVLPMLRLMPLAEDAKPAILEFDVVLHSTEGYRNIVIRFREFGIPFQECGPRKLRVRNPNRVGTLSQIAAMPEVAAIEPYVLPRPLNDVGCRLIGLYGAGGSSSRVLSQTGKGELIAVADTGIDDTHSDFQGRIRHIEALGRTNDGSDPNGHGTHVSATAVGDGTASSDDLQGVAPAAELYFQSLMDSAGGLTGLPRNLASLFQPAYDGGARVHNNSWGAATNSRYTANASEVDDFVRNNRDMLIVFATGNDGDASNPTHGKSEYVSFSSIDSPATAKNAISVGARRSDRTKGGYAKLKHGGKWRRQFPDPPIRDERISGDPEALGGFSSRGPADDEHRIKPDLVAPGTDIASAWSSTASRAKNAWGPYPGTNKYAYLGGTSMAAPFVAGAAALLREYFLGLSPPHDPSAALIKATLINGTRRLGAADAIFENDDFPNWNQGFGSVDLGSTLPNGTNPDLKLSFIDNWQDQGAHLGNSGDKAEFKITIDADGELRVCLAYTDAGGGARSVQNNLNLIVEHGDSCERWFGNKDRYRGPASRQPDPHNNIEIVRIEDAPEGEYLIQISAIDLLVTPQDFALVVTGKLTSDMEAVT